MGLQKMFGSIDSLEDSSSSSSSRQSRSSMGSGFVWGIDAGADNSDDGVTPARG